MGHPKRAKRLRTKGGFLGTQLLVYPLFRAGLNLSTLLSPSPLECCFQIRWPERYMSLSGESSAWVQIRCNQGNSCCQA